MSSSRNLCGAASCAAPGPRLSSADITGTSLATLGVTSTETVTRISRETSSTLQVDQERQDGTGSCNASFLRPRYIQLSFAAEF